MERFFRGARHEAIHEVNKYNNDDPETKHAKGLDIEDQARELSVRYAQWSIAAEKAALMSLNTKEGYKGKAYHGRGLKPKYQDKSIATKSSDK